MDALNKIANKLKLIKDDIDEKIKAKLKAEMDKRNFGEADATRHVIDRDRGEVQPPKPKKEPLLQAEMCKYSEHGQWKIEKSNYGPKGMGQYTPVDNIKRKANRTGEEVEGVGQNKAVHRYTTTGSAMTEAAEAARLKEEKFDAKVEALSPEKKARREKNIELGRQNAAAIEAQTAVHKPKTILRKPKESVAKGDNSTLRDSHEKIVNVWGKDKKRRMEMHETPTHWKISVHTEGEQYPQVHTGKEGYIRQKWNELKKSSDLDDWGNGKSFNSFLTEEELRKRNSFIEEE